MKRRKGEKEVLYYNYTKSKLRRGRRGGGRRGRREGEMGVWWL
jgi:hypothetical protein